MAMCLFPDLLWYAWQLFLTHKTCGDETWFDVGLVWRLGQLMAMANGEGYASAKPRADTKEEAARSFPMVQTFSSSLFVSQIDDV
ncbi:hypothetical protein J3F84DRAFT_375308 [Trichoderma pleuroticola]